MGDSRYRLPLQSSYSFSGTSSSDQLPRPPKRRLSSSMLDPFALPRPATTQPTPRFFDNMATFDSEQRANAAQAIAHSMRHNALAVAHHPSLDPSPEDPGAVFIHPPFASFPDAHKYKDGLNYNLMAANPEWFLDPRDYITTTKSEPDAIRYPQQLEPPRGWCPAKKKDLKEGWPEGEEPRLRCTFCRRTYAGVNAKSMWRRHVYEKHKIAMSNRRDNQERKGRSFNKENKESRASVDDAGQMSSHHMNGYHSQASEMQANDMPSLGYSSSHSLDRMDEDLPAATSSSSVAGPSTLVGESDVFFVDSSSNTPPLTPGTSPTNPLTSRLKNSVSVTESPYNPLLTPSFRHSPARLPIDQPWRFPSPSHPLHQGAKELSLTMLMRAEASPIVSGLDVSPLVIVPASERRKRSFFSSPFAKADAPDKDLYFDGDSGEKLPPLPKSVRKLVKDSFLPTPFTDRVKFKQHRIPESPLGRSFVGIEKSLVSVAKANDSWRSGGPMSPAKTPRKGMGLLDAIELDESDTFVGMLYKAVDDGTKGIFSPPSSSSETDSPVLRSSQRLQAESSAADGGGLGIGLMEGFSLKDVANDKEDDDLLFIQNFRKSEHLPISDGSPFAPIGKKSYRQFLNASTQDTGDLEMHETAQPKKRRRTINGRD
ncbi:hypothetical protein EIP91_005554 [Steccherinum ochraceum]|uniref:Uncharacterized protein n=1 Tax=Steccherinum ochraceum TaxID=92696 RepID=A0A4R0RTY9_9APHY|nr:hypothetical protein EIP91_005554 [Steccherinum ochraceum]